MGYNEHYKKREEKMNLAKKYKQLFEGKVRSNDSTLLSEALARGLKPLLIIGSNSYPQAEPNPKTFSKGKSFIFSNPWILFII